MAASLTGPFVVCHVSSRDFICWFVGLLSIVLVVLLICLSRTVCFMCSQQCLEKASACMYDCCLYQTVCRTLSFMCDAQPVAAHGRRRGE